MEGQCDHSNCRCLKANRPDRERDRSPTLPLPSDDDEETTKERIRRLESAVLYWREQAQEAQVHTDFYRLELLRAKNKVKELERKLEK